MTRAGRSGFHFDGMSVRFERGGGGQFEGRLRALHFDFCQRHGLARLGNEQLDELIGPASERIGNFPQQARALDGRHVTRFGE